MTEDTIFHKIVRGEAPSYVIHEDDNHLAILDIFPQFYGQTLIIPKQAAPSRFSQVEPDTLSTLMLFGQQVAKILETKIENIDRCIALIEGFEVDYLHLKLLPTGKQSEGEQVILTSPEKASEEELKSLFKLLKG